MFEDVCLTCGKHLYDDDQVYCSDDCQNLDTSSPSISSASSAVSSPTLGFATGGDVPALVPSALGTALTSAAFHRRRHQYSVSSSSASSTSWSIMTDEDEDIDDFAGIGSYGSNFHSSVDSFHEGISKSASGVDPQKSSAALFYARRPSGTNNHSTLSGLHNRSSSGHVPHAPRSAPLHSHLGVDEDIYSDVSFSSKEESDSEIYPPKSVTKNKRNRASLPGCFSLLQANPTEHKRMASQTSSSGHTVTTQRKTPPTPKLPLLNALSNLTLSSPTSLTTPRGRRRTQGESSSSRRSGSSSSRSPSRSRWPAAQLSPFRAREDSDVQLSGRFHVTSEAPRGRATHRRNSSPPPKMTVTSFDKHRFGSGETRGRQRVGDDLHAPGYGHGRSGLLDRERALGGRTTRVL